jgi:quercetin dioxygenase-like cupin family protein
MIVDLMNNDGLRWKRFTGSDDFGYPIDYSAALLHARADGHVELLYRWAPNSYCHFHRHTAETTSVVLEGELHVIDVDPETGEEVGRRVRRAGDYAQKGPGDVHMEKGGPEGAVVLFSLYAADGRLAESLAPDGRVIGVSTVADILRGASSRSAA